MPPKAKPSTKEKVNWKHVERLAAVRVPPAEIAAALRVSLATLEREAKRRGFASFMDFWVCQVALAGVTLRRMVHERALQGDLRALEMAAALDYLVPESTLNATFATLPHAKKPQAKLKRRYIQCLVAGMTRGEAARACGLDRKTIWRWRQQDPKFNEMCEEAQSALVEAVEDALFKAALGGNVVAQQVILYNRAPERWADRRHVRVSGPTGGPVEVEVSLEDQKRLAEALGAYAAEVLGHSAAH